MAYPSKVIQEGSFDSYQTGEAIALYQRVKFSTVESTDGSGKPKILIAAATDRAIGVAMQGGASGAFITIKLLNAPGENFGIAVGTITLGVLVYQAAAGALTAASGGGALVAGVSTSTGANGGTLTYMPLPNGA